MNESTSNQLNEYDYSSKTHQFDEILEEAAKFYKHYSKLANFSTKIRNTTRDGDKIKNHLIVCTREGRWKSKISPTLKTNPSAGLNYPARIYVHIMKDVGVWTISKAEILKQHRELSIFVHRTIETHEEARIRPSKTYQSFVAAAGSHRELGFIEKDVRSYIIREVRNISEEDDANEFGKYLTHLTKTGTISLQSIASEATSGFQEAEREFDAADFHTLIPCVTKSAIEAQFQHVYTHEKFREVQAQFRGKVNCITRSMHSTLGFTTYEVIEQVSNSTFHKFVVTYDACHCLLFESRGILCHHSLSVLNFERVNNVAPKYILERWSKKIKRRHTHIKNSQDEPLLEPRSKRFDELLNLLDSASLIQSSSTLYNVPDMNYPREDCTRLERAAEGFDSLIALDFLITCFLILFISCNRRFGPYWYLKSSISSYISIERN
ncbi:hypothetical protein Ahy_B02g059916 [Arachis hypogaea]|uniref:Protein FAR1-RELATED SEQUENCE n=1 Tax=Arachis hypogaea TaxID=3818 RepID=A0A445AHK2_ARAHY|nr:hypothetical protein Ahy_B02g059916 [Arachis hypogaea]